MKYKCGPFIIQYFIKQPLPEFSLAPITRRRRPVRTRISQHDEATCAELKKERCTAYKDFGEFNHKLGPRVSLLDISLLCTPVGTIQCVMRTVYYFLADS